MDSVKDFREQTRKKTDHAEQAADMRFRDKYNKFVIYFKHNILIDTDRNVWRRLQRDAVTDSVSKLVPAQLSATGGRLVHFAL